MSKKKTGKKTTKKTAPKKAPKGKPATNTRPAKKPNKPPKEEAPASKPTPPEPNAVETKPSATDAKESRYYGSPRHMQAIATQCAVIDKIQEDLRIAIEREKMAKDRVKALETERDDAYQQLKTISQPTPAFGKDGQGNLLHDEGAASDLIGQDSASANKPSARGKSDEEAIKEHTQLIVDQAAAKTGPNPLDARRNERLLDLAGFPARARAPLAMNNVHTLGDLLDLMHKSNARGDNWFAEVKGISTTLGDEVSDFMVKLFHDAAKELAAKQVAEQRDAEFDAAALKEGDRVYVESDDDAKPAKIVSIDKKKKAALIQYEESGNTAKGIPLAKLRPYVDTSKAFSVGDCVTHDIDGTAYRQIPEKIAAIHNNGNALIRYDDGHESTLPIDYLSACEDSSESAQSESASDEEASDAEADKISDEHEAEESAWVDESEADDPAPDGDESEDEESDEEEESDED